MESSIKYTELAERERPSTLSFEENLLSGEEFIHLYDMNTSKNSDFPCWRCDPFDLDELLDDKCKNLNRKRFQDR